jgi:hypothetical protein
MAFRTNSSSTAVSWEEMMDWSRQLADKIKQSDDKDVKSIFPVDHEDIIPAWMVAKNLGIGILPGHADLNAKYLAFHVDNSVFSDIAFVNYHLEGADTQILSVPKHFVLNESYIDEEPKKTYQYPWYNI